jgi:hypothetical protein
MLSRAAGEKRVTTLGDVLKFLIEKGPGRTEAQLAEAIYGRQGRQPYVNQDCRLLLSAGKIRRQGGGGPWDPHTYYPAFPERALSSSRAARSGQSI